MRIILNLKKMRKQQVQGVHDGEHKKKKKKKKKKQQTKTAKETNLKAHI